tara:strand:- start:211 stop:654 length:444 start_codon:yes stop_codon:yes gene_type:complete
MIIKTLQLDEKHWSTNWIPISYILGNKNYSKSLTFLWATDYQVNAICRAYYISKIRIEIGDIWLNDKYRGRYDKYGNKYSVKFMKKIIAKIWKIYKSATKISLIVDEKNVPAIKLYEKLNFKKIRMVTNKTLKITRGIYMERVKRSF